MKRLFLNKVIVILLSGIPIYLQSCKEECGMFQAISEDGLPGLVLKGFGGAQIRELNHLTIVSGRTPVPVVAPLSRIGSDTTPVFLSAA